MIKLSEIIENDKITNIEEANASEKEFIGLVRGSKTIILRKCKITKEIVEDENGNVFEITSFDGGVKFMSTKKISDSRESNALLFQMMKEIKDDMKKGFKEVHSEIASIKEDISIMKEDISVLKEDVTVLKKDVAVLKEDVAILKEDVTVLKKDVSILKKDVAVLKEDVADINQCPTIKKELKELKKNKK
ncbi:MAG: hypothetical protein HUJ42_00670 [Malacoplasma sp.]|nr:hypothetical protein [Malacoplasma sp.]